MFLPCKIPLLLLTNSTVPACKFCRKVDCACKFCRKVDCACKFRHVVIEQLAATSAAAASAADETQQTGRNLRVQAVEFVWKEHLSNLWVI